MKKLIFQSAYKYWQEFLFLISIVVLLFEIINYNLTKNSIDNLDLALILIVSLLFVSTIINLFWRNHIFSKILSTLFSVVSIVIILMAIYFVSNTSTAQLEALSMLFFGVILLIAALTMNSKYKSIVN